MGMSFAPAPLLSARAYVITELGVQPTAVGIVGNTATHFGGYHLGWDRLRQNRGKGDYSVSESFRDSKPTDAASALDIGLFNRSREGRALTLPNMSKWLVAQCQAGTPDTRDIREIIYSPDGRVVRRWDRLGVRTGGDNSHLYHTHISYFRDSETRDKTALFRRYVEGDDMVTQEEIEKIGAEVWRGPRWEKLHLPGETTSPQGAVQWSHKHLNTLIEGQAEMLALLKVIAGADLTTAVHEAVVQAIGDHDTAIRAALVDLGILVESAVSGESDAAAVVDELGRRLRGSVPE